MRQEDLQDQGQTGLVYIEKPHLKNNHKTTTQRSETKISKSDFPLFPEGAWWTTISEGEDTAVIRKGWRASVWWLWKNSYPKGDGTQQRNEITMQDSETQTQCCRNF